MEVKHTVGENQKLYDLLGIDSGEHTPVTEQLCEFIRNMMCCLNCYHRFDGEYRESCTGTSCLSNKYSGWGPRHA